MIHELKEKALEQNIRFTAVPLNALSEVKADIEKLAAENELNAHQKAIISKRYIFDIAELDFTPRSIVVAIWRQNFAKAVFKYKGAETSCFVEDYSTHHKGQSGNIFLNRIFMDAGISLKYIGMVPQKLLAVRSGLSEYGRNNITYSSDWGSYARIGTYLSNIEPDEYTWRNTVNMARCKSCGLCIKNCPTKAILPERFLIDSELCLSRLNSTDGEDMPGWIPESAHNSVYGCHRCQDICPANKNRLKDIEKIIFEEEETEAILNAKTFTDFPKGTRVKLWYYNTGRGFSCIPRNLKLMLNNTGSIN